jgi:ABC-type amino acid transport substrate-binding protein
MGRARRLAAGSQANPVGRIEGGPYVEADPRDPARVVGFEVDIAALIASKLGLRPRFQSVQFASIDASVKRGDYLIGLSGVEDTPARRATLAVTVPYYEFREVLTVRAADASRIGRSRPERQARGHARRRSRKMILLVAGRGRRGGGVVRR